MEDRWTERDEIYREKEREYEKKKRLDTDSFPIRSRKTDFIAYTLNVSLLHCYFVSLIKTFMQQ